VRLFVGDDSSEGHHDVEVMDEAGKVLARRRLPEGVAGMAQLHGLIGGFLPAPSSSADGQRPTRRVLLGAMPTATRCVWQRCQTQILTI